MATEIERKYLVTGDTWRKNASRTRYRQGYLCADTERTVRIRLAGQTAWLTVKGKTKGAARAEFEYSIPLSDAGYMLEKLCVNSLIEKYRYTLTYRDLTWVIDEFMGDNSGLIIAEVELDSEDQKFDKPEWVGREVTGDVKYYNANLTRNPYKKWNK